jgi:hypothetical protein
VRRCNTYDGEIVQPAVTELHFYRSTVFAQTSWAEKVLQSPDQGRCACEYLIKGSHDFQVRPRI